MHGDGQVAVGQLRHFGSGAQRVQHRAEEQRGTTAHHGGDGHHDGQAGGGQAARVGGAPGTDGARDDGGNANRQADGD